MSGAKLYQERTLGNSTSDIALTGNASSSKYGISISARPKEDSDMKSYLDDKVNEAYDYIKELQDEIDNLYSSADKKIMDYYDAVFQRIAENGWIVDNNTSRNKTTSSTYLNNKYSEIVSKFNGELDAFDIALLSKGIIVYPVIILLLSV